MSDTVKRIRHSTASIAVSAVLVAVGLMTVGLWILGLLQTSSVVVGELELEQLLIENDMPLLSLLGMGVMAVGLLLLHRLLSRLEERELLRLLPLYTLIAAALFVLCAQSAPTHDSYQVTHAGAQIWAGNLRPLKEAYFRYYPFQLGYVAWTEFWSFLIMESGNYLPLQLVNVLCLALGSYCLGDLTRRLFPKGEGLRFFVCLYLIFPQAIWFCTFLYGNIPSFCFASLAVDLLVIYLKRERTMDLLMSGLAILMAVWLKLNSMIVFVAMVITLLVHLWQKGKWRMLPGLAALILLIPMAKDLPIAFYEARTGIEFGEGIPMVAWASMGLHSARGDKPGWYNGGITTGVYEQYGGDGEQITAHSLTNIQKRLDAFRQDPSMALTFFGRKIASQWNEPTFQSIWNVQVRHQYLKRGGVAKAVCDDAPRLFATLCDWGHLVNLFGAMIGLWAMLRRRESTDLILPLIVLGGFLYHLIFEAKSQYILTYLLWLMPICAYGWSLIGARIKRFGRKPAGEHATEATSNKKEV